MRIKAVLVFCFVAFTIKAEAQTNILQRYTAAYKQLDERLKSPYMGLFKEAVFLTENTFWGDTLSRADFEGEIAILTVMANGYIQANPQKDYKLSDSLNFSKNYALYKLLADTITIQLPDGRIATTLPYKYDFFDFFGREAWSNMFVSKLFKTHKGNCHSLPYLYKILADELEATCWLGLAPNHIYIKNRCRKTGWYNTELTSGTFPIDAWVTASGYIPLQAIQNGIYMDTLSNQQAVALCVLDLAKGYEFQTKNYYDGFILKCCDLVLQYHPLNVQAMLLKAETLKRNYQREKEAKNEEAANSYKQMEALYTKLFELGYREMPESMYLQWLKSIEQEKAKYQNKAITNDTPVKKKAF
ncbi:MAG: hypothetical protein J0I32_05115 [Sphingobacteriales bacterium]|nr:hypothetical protein [Sphingobacteriales bacterium]